MIFNKLYGQYFVLFQSFNKNKIVEVYVLDTETRKLYFKAFLCNKNRYPSVFTEPADIYNTEYIHPHLYKASTTVRVKYDTIDFELLLLYALNDEYNSMERQGKPTTEIFRDLDIYLDSNNYLEMSFSRYNTATIYLKLLPINDKDMQTYMQYELTTYMFKKYINILENKNSKTINKLEDISSAINMISDNIAGLYKKIDELDKKIDNLEAKIK